MFPMTDFIFSAATSCDFLIALLEASTIDFSHFFWFSRIE